MNEPTQEEVKRFWEKCGLRIDIGRGLSVLPNGNMMFCIPELTLDNLDRYAVRLLKERGGTVHIDILQDGVWVSVEYKGHPEDVFDEVFKVALYHAVDKVLEG